MSNQALWHKRFIFVARCFPSLWFQEVWARRVAGRWEYKKTTEGEDLDKHLREW
jgi:hypothetical protein